MIDYETKNDGFTCWDVLLVLFVSGVFFFKKFFKYHLGCSSSCSCSRGGDTAGGSSFFSSLLSLSLQLLSELLSFSSPSSLDELSSSTDISLLVLSALRQHDNDQNTRGLLTIEKRIRAEVRYSLGRVVCTIRRYDVDRRRTAAASAVLVGRRRRRRRRRWRQTSQLLGILDTKTNDARINIHKPPKSKVTGKSWAFQYFRLTCNVACCDDCGIMLDDPLTDGLTIYLYTKTKRPWNTILRNTRRVTTSTKVGQGGV